MATRTPLAPQQLLQRLDRLLLHSGGGPLLFLDRFAGLLTGRTAP